MSSLSDALLEEHRAFAAKIEELRRLADDCSDERPGSVVADVEASLRFLEHDLLPHAAMEEDVLYPAVARLLGAPAATATMRRDHEEIRRLVHDLRRHSGELGTAVHPAAVAEVRRLLYSLHAIISLHVAKEEEIYLPLLDAALGDAEVDRLVQKMQQAVRRHVSTG